jgi:hypothetical protein
MLNVGVVVQHPDPLFRPQLPGCPFAELPPLPLCQALSLCRRKHNMNARLLAARIQTGQTLEFLDHLSGSHRAQ